jgi:cob(I)alamin adenosyltransferase
MTGYVHVITGNGKGKTTAALGLAVQAAGRGERVFFTQFIKGNIYSEIKALNRMADYITIKQFGLGRFMGGKPYEADIRAAKEGIEEVKTAMASGRYGVVIMDEANVAVAYKLFSEEKMIEVIEHKPSHLNLIITGRAASSVIKERADIVTEMKEIKHYYKNRVKARVGIEK